MIVTGLVFEFLQYVYLKVKRKFPKSTNNRVVENDYVYFFTTVF